MPSWAGDFIWYLKAVEHMKLPPLHPPDSIVSWAELSIVFHPISDQKMYTTTYISVIRRRENGFDMSYQISLGMGGDYGFFTTTRRAIEIFWLCIWKLSCHPSLYTFNKCIFKDLQMFFTLLGFTTGWQRLDREISMWFFIHPLPFVAPF